MATFDYRRELSVRETLPALGAAVAAGAGVFYLARLLIARTPLRPSAEIAGADVLSPRRPQPAPKVGRPARR